MNPMVVTNPQQDFEFTCPGIAVIDRLAQLVDMSRVFRGLSMEALETLAEHLMVYRLPAGRTLLHEDERSTFAVWLLDGVVEVRKRADNGTDTAIATILPGKLIGEMSLIDGEPRFATCVIIRDAEFAVFSQAAFQILLEDHPRLAAEIALRFAAQINQRLRQTSRKLVAALLETPNS